MSKAHELIMEELGHRVWHSLERFAEACHEMCRPEITEEDIEYAFNVLGKYGYNE